MTSYKEKQLKIVEELEKKFKNGDASASIVKPIKDYANDERIFLGGVAFLPKKLQATILSKIIRPLKTADNRQYYYLPESLHVTVQNVRVINKPPHFNEIDIERARTAFGEVIQKFRPFDIEIRRILETPVSLSVCAFSEEVFGDMIMGIRKKLVEFNIPDDKKYASNETVFSNTTICRYTTKPNTEFLDKARALKQIKIGKMKIKEVSLITGNAVCHPDSVRVIEKFHLSKYNV